MLLLLLLLLFYKSYKVNHYKLHSWSRPNYNLIRLLNEEIDLASFTSIESWFQSMAPLNLKLVFRNALFGLGSVRSVAVLRRWQLVWSTFLLTNEFLRPWAVWSFNILYIKTDLKQRRPSSGVCQERKSIKSTWQSQLSVSSTWTPRHLRVLYRLIICHNSLLTYLIVQIVGGPNKQDLDRCIWSLFLMSHFRTLSEIRIKLHDKFVCIMRGSEDLCIVHIHTWSC